jgi:hypothetical protein
MASKKLTIYTITQIIIFFGLSIFASVYFKGCYDHDSNCNPTSTVLLIVIFSIFMILSVSTTCFLCMRERRRHMSYTLI